MTARVVSGDRAIVIAKLVKAGRTTEIQAPTAPRAPTVRPAQGWVTEQTCATATPAKAHMDVETAWRVAQASYVRTVTCQQQMDQAMGAPVSVISVRLQ